MEADLKYIMDFTQASVDTRSKELIKAFANHYKAYIELCPKDAEKRGMIFEGWAIQKIAGLQVMLELIIQLMNPPDRGN
jgi:hypothetical protein